jgi:predicted nucleotidyltransferase
VFADTQKIDLPASEVQSQIEKVRLGIQKAIDPKAVILFGSAARGKMTTHSDIDILIICKDQDHLKASMKALAPHRPLSSYSMDIVWYTSADFMRKKELGG